MWQVLDLDETLVHCSVDPIPDADLTFGVEFNGANYMVYVRKRPFLDRFLELVYEKFEVTVFTASQVGGEELCFCGGRWGLVGGRVWLLTAIAVLE